MNFIVYSHYAGGPALVSRGRPSKGMKVLSSHQTAEDAVEAARALNAKRKEGKA